MSDPTQDCQVPSGSAGRVGDSGVDPPAFGEDVFVADAGTALDVPHVVNTTNPVVTACIQTTRCIGAVDENGFLLDAEQLVERGFLAETLLLTVRGLIHDRDAGGVLGRDLLDVEVVLRRGTAHEVSLGDLQGGYRGRWETYRVDVPVGALAYPADPCPDQNAVRTCGVAPTPQANEISFVFSGSDLPVGTSTSMTFTIDWLALAPKTGTRLAARPVMLANGWIGSAHSWDDSAWQEHLDFERIPYHVVELPGHGSVVDNAALVTGFAHDLAQRFGVERITIVSHSKGGVDSREHIRNHDDVGTLIMIGTPNAGTPLADVTSYVFAETRDLTPAAMANYNAGYIPNLGTTHVTASGDCDSKKAKALGKWMGPNDEVIPADSVNSLAYATAFPYATSVNDGESQGICAAKHLTNHSCLIFLQRIVDDVLPPFLTIAGAKPGAAEAATARAEPVPSVQTITTDTGVASAGTVNVHAVVVDAVDAVTFVVVGDPAVFEAALVTPDGTRFDGATEDPDVTPFSSDDLGPLSHRGFDVQHPAAGTWSVEVTGTTGTPSGPEAEEAEPTAYAIGALAPLVTDVGVALIARLERPVLPAGGPVTVVATVTENGTAVADATVTALVVAPGDAGSPEVTLLPDGAGSYRGVLAELVDAGTYDIKVSATRTEPAFTREQRLQAVVTPAGTAFTGSVTDHGADDDGDGLFEHLLVDVGLVVEVTGTYRVFGTLEDSATSSAIEQVRVEAPLDAGPGSVTLAFSGSRLFDLQIDGPYLVTDLVLQDAPTSTVVAFGEPHSTEAYVHAQFQRPPVLLTGTTADRGVNTPDKPLTPFEALEIDVEVDLLVASHLEAEARLRSSDGTLVDLESASVDLPAGRFPLTFTFSAPSIFRAGFPGPYTLGELTIAGTSDRGSFDLTEAGVVAVTQAYALEDFAPSPDFTVGGTVTGLVGTGLLLELNSGDNVGQLSIRANGPFTFRSPRIFAGIGYEVRVRVQPSNPPQVCTVVNGSGVLGDANVTDVQVVCR